MSNNHVTLGKRKKYTNCVFGNPARFYFTAQRKKYGRENSLSVETHELNSSSKKLKTVFIVITTMVYLKD